MAPHRINGVGRVACPYLSSLAELLCPVMQDHLRQLAPRWPPTSNERNLQTLGRSIRFFITKNLKSSGANTKSDFDELVS